jgi:hypothetical protein
MLALAVSWGSTQGWTAPQQHIVSCCAPPQPTALPFVHILAEHAPHTSMHHTPAWPLHLPMTHQHHWTACPHTPTHPNPACTINT